MGDQFGNYGQQPPYGQPPQGSSYQPGQQMPPYQGPAQGIPSYGMPKKRSGTSGCLVGCLVAVVLVVAAVVGFGFYGWHWIKTNGLEQTPLTIQVPVLTQEQQDELKAKLAPVAAAFKDDTGEILTLTLTQDEVNWLLNNDEIPQPEDKKGFKAAFEFPEDGTLNFKVSASFAPNIGKPPFLNAVGSAKFEVLDGKLVLNLLSGRVGKVEVSKMWLDGINQNLSQQLQTDPNMQYIWERLREAKIEKGKVNLTLRAIKMPTKEGDDIPAEQPIEPTPK